MPGAVLGAEDPMVNQTVRFVSWRKEMESKHMSKLINFKNPGWEVVRKPWKRLV